MADFRNTYDIRNANPAVPMIDTAGSDGWVVHWNGKEYKRKFTAEELERIKQYNNNRTTTPYKTFSDAVRAAERVTGQKLPEWQRAVGKFKGGWWPVGTVVAGVKFEQGVPCEETVSDHGYRWASFWICGKVAKTDGLCGLHASVKQRRDDRDAQYKAQREAREAQYDREDAAYKAAMEIKAQVVALLEGDFAAVDKLITVTRAGEMKITPEILLTLAQTHDAFRRL